MRRLLYTLLLLALVPPAAWAQGTGIGPPNCLDTYRGPSLGKVCTLPPAGALANAQLTGVGGLIYTTSATAATGTGTSEQVLGSYSLPANALDAVGRRLRMRASFSAAANGNNKTFLCYFGASVITSGVLTTNAKNGFCEVHVVKTGASTQIVWANMLVDTTWITGYKNTASTETDTAAIVIKMSGTDGTSSAGDIVLNDMAVEYLN